MCTDSSPQRKEGFLRSGTYAERSFERIIHNAGILCSRVLSHLGQCLGAQFQGWGKVLVVEGFECTIKCQTKQKAGSHSITNVCLTAFHSIPSSDSASEAPLYVESEDEVTDPKMSLRLAAQQNTQTQGDPAKLFVLISSEVPRAIHVAVLQCHISHVVAPPPPTLEVGGAVWGVVGGVGGV